MEFERKKNPTTISKECNSKEKNEFWKNVNRKNDLSHPQQIMLSIIQWTWKLFSQKNNSAFSKTVTFLMTYIFLGLCKQNKLFYCFFLSICDVLESTDQNVYLAYASRPNSWNLAIVKVLLLFELLGKSSLVSTSGDIGQPKFSLEKLVITCKTQKS